MKEKHEDFCPLCRAKVSRTGKTEYAPCPGCKNTLLVPSDYLRREVEAVYHGYMEESRPLSWSEYKEMQEITLAKAIEKKAMAAFSH